MNKTLLLCSLLLAFSCSTSSLVAPDLEKVYQDNGKNTGGVVVYNPHGLEQLVEARRNQAFKRMRAVCQPLTFEITNEENDKPVNRNPKYKDNVTNLTGNTVRFVEFDCIEI